MKERIVILGRVGSKPKLKLIKNGTKKVCIFDIVENSVGGKSPKWHKIVAWDKQAEGCNVILAKGKEVFVHGRVIPKEYKKESGEIKQYEEIYADKIGFVTL